MNVTPATSATRAPLTHDHGPALIWCPFPDLASAEAAANALLDARLIACANLIPAMRVLFAWQGERNSGEEVGALLKTDSVLLAKAIDHLETLHPYETPAILGWRCGASTSATANWLAELVA